MSSDEVEICSISYTGRDSMEKRRELALLMRKNNSRAIIITKVEDICWLLNIRGISGAAAAVLLQNGDILLFTNMNYSEEVREWLWSVDIVPFESFVEYLENNSHFLTSITVDLLTIGSDYYSKIKSSTIYSNYKDYFVLKSLKNPIEIDNLKEINQWENKIFSEVCQYIRNNDETIYCNEITNNLRSKNKGYLGGSFEMEPLKNSKVVEGYILRMESNYLQGKTRSSRTVFLTSNNNMEVKRACYTMALKMQMAFAMCHFNTVAELEADSIIKSIKNNTSMDVDMAVEITNDFGSIDDVNLPYGGQVLNIKTVCSCGTTRAELNNAYLLREEDDLFLESTARTAINLEILTVLALEDDFIDYSQFTDKEKEWLEYYRKYIS